MKKYCKLALDEEQIKTKSQYDRFDGYEIHLFGDQRDNFELIKTINKPVITIHYPISNCDVYDVAYEYRTEYAQKVFDLCQKCHAGLVVHAETSLNHLKTNPYLDEFCEYIKKEKITLHVENCYRNVGAIEGLKITSYLKEKIQDDLVYPLLDTCHLIMSEMSFKFDEMSFFKTIEAYASNNFKMHLNDCIGSGEVETGGTHGTNFFANQYLLRNILWKLKEMNVDVDFILEVEEEDHRYPLNANVLAKNIDQIIEKFK